MISRKLKKKYSGLSSLELIISLTLLIILMVGISGILAVMGQMHQLQKDMKNTNLISKKITENIQFKASSDINYYLNMQGTKEANLTSNVFNSMNFNTFDQKYLSNFVGFMEVQSCEAKTTKALIKGNNLNIFIDKNPTQIGITNDLPYIIYDPISNQKETFFVKSINDSAMKIQVDDSSPEKGRTGLIKDFPSGSIVFGSGKIVKVSVFYADKNNIDNRSKLNTKALATSVSILNFPKVN